MTKSVSVMGMGVGEAILAAIVLIIMLAFMAQAALDEMATNQQVTNFIKFRSQVASVCEMVKVNKNTPYESNKEYVVLYPFYDIRFYNKTADMPTEIQSTCNGDKCACLVKMGKAGWGDTASCYIGYVGANYVKCQYNARPIDAVLSCFNMPQLGCDYQLWFAKGKENPIKNYDEEGIKATCKFEGAVTWDRTGFFYNKRSEFCEKGKR